MQDMESDSAVCDNSGKSRETFRVRYPKGYLRVQHSFSAISKGV